MLVQMIFVLIVIVAMVSALLFEIARPDMIVFSALVVLLLSGILTTEEALRGFSNPGMLTIALLFIVVGTVQKHGLIDQMMIGWLNKGKSLKGSLFRIFLPLPLISAFLNNTPIVVTLTPLLKKWCEERNIAPSKVLIPLSYVTILGGTITLMGTSTNLVVHGMLIDYGLPGFSLFQLAIVGIPITIVGLIYLFTIGNMLLPENKGFSKQVTEDSRKYIAEMVVEETFPHTNQTVEQAKLRDLKGLYLIEIIRDQTRISSVSSKTIIQSGDRLIFTGLIATIADLQKRKGLTLKTGTDLQLEDLKNGNTQLAEAVVSHESSLLSKTIKQSQFRSRYDAGVMAVHRNNERIKSKVGDIILRPGDTLLLLAGTGFVEKYQQSNDFYVVSSMKTPKSLEESRFVGWFSLLVLLGAIALVIVGWLTMFKAMALAVLILLVTKSVSMDDAKNDVQFNVLLLIASAFGVGAAMTKTGLAQWAADGLLAVGQPFGLLAILILIYLLTSIFTELITNSAAAVLMIPIGIEMASNLQLDPMGFAVIITIAASASFITPIGYQTNLIVYGPGGYKFMDYVKVGTPLSILVMSVTIGIVYYYWF
ncbi:di/tricarboxylate transporter [Planomicrobium stackebrandtii]|uniref:Di/tricarboxylate transporter n=1 Tax=Planomicrobium stackebrandtii TaxID=253160 RepID=A0ABU0H0N0_9BACL|nr:SLC13 family permease [Planomicrobium stackebrandtii]MDQ0430764.1 di/tricarboxylate transporter [Planomicrobium stackebrandtii]